MLMAHGLLVLVVDGSQMKLLRNCGNEARPKLEIVAERHLDNPPTRELGTSPPGRSFESANSARHAYPVEDRHARRERDLGLEALHRLQAELLPDTPAVLIAPPALLGELRKVIKPDLMSHIVAQFDKDLTHYAPQEIASFLIDSRS
jgi:protein required for attachment to host cells